MHMAPWPALVNTELRHSCTAERPAASQKDSAARSVCNHVLSLRISSKSHFPGFIALTVNLPPVMVPVRLCPFITLSASPLPPQATGFPSAPPGLPSNRHCGKGEISWEKRQEREAGCSPPSGSYTSTPLYVLMA